MPIYFFTLERNTINHNFVPQIYNIIITYTNILRFFKNFISKMREMPLISIFFVRDREIYHQVRKVPLKRTKISENDILLYNTPEKK